MAVGVVTSNFTRDMTSPLLTDFTLPATGLVLPRSRSRGTSLSAGYRLSDLLSINVSVRNVFDKAYADSADENHILAPGRGTILSLSGVF